MKQTLKLLEGSDWKSFEQADKLFSAAHISVFVSGGSSVVLGIQLLDLLKEADLLDRVRLFQVDERYGEIDHTDANHPSFDGYAAENGIVFERILAHGTSAETAADSYGEIVAQAIDRPDHCSIAVLGMGLDGHTAGILPASKQVYDARFSTDNLYVGYTGDDFTRVTAGQALLNKIDIKLCYVAGQEKLQLIESIRSERPAANVHPIVTVINDIQFVTKKESV